MSQPRRSIGPVIAYMLTLLGLILGGIWLWNAVHGTLAPHGGQAVPATLPQAATTPAGGEDIGTAERQQLNDVLRRHPAGATH